MGPDRAQPSRQIRAQAKAKFGRSLKGDSELEISRMSLIEKLSIERLKSGRKKGGK
jgi:hypothetical protein